MSDLEHEDLLTALVASRAQLVDRMDDAQGQAYAALYKAYLDVQDKIRELTPTQTKDTPLDEFTRWLDHKRGTGS